MSRRFAKEEIVLQAIASFGVGGASPLALYEKLRSWGFLYDQDEIRTLTRPLVEWDQVTWSPSGNSIHITQKGYASVDQMRTKLE